MQSMLGVRYPRIASSEEEESISKLRSTPVHDRCQRRTERSTRMWSAKGRMLTDEAEDAEELHDARSRKDAELSVAYAERRCENDGSCRDDVDEGLKAEEVLEPAVQCSDRVRSCSVDSERSWGTHLSCATII
eukprot:773164-Rhodomonas_salina.2